MKNLLTLILLAFTITTFSQIGETKTIEERTYVGIANKGVGYPALSYKHYEGRKTIYVLSYLNHEYNYIRDHKSTVFSATEEELNALYDFLIEGFDIKEARTIRVGSDEFWVYKMKNSSALRISVTHSKDTDGWFYITKRQLQKLFGKI